MMPAGTADGKGENDPMNSMNGNRPTDPKENLPHVVIVGGGFAGISAARALRRAPVRVTLIDRQNSHVFRPMLYQVATGILAANEIASPIRSILRQNPNADVLMAEVTGIDTQNRHVLMGERSLTYDYLILATGVRDNYFGHDDWKPLAPGLHSLSDAEGLRARILGVFEEAEQRAAEGTASQEELEALLTFVLVGAGPTGVELAGSIAGLSRLALAGEFRHIDPRSARILLCEAAPRILPAFPEDLAGKARHRLEQMGVDVRTGGAVQQVDAEGVILGGQRIPSRTVIWSAGVSASPAGQWLGAEVDRAGRVKVNPDLSVPGHPNVFVIGDTTSVVAPVRSLFRAGRRLPQPRPIPGLAAAAAQGGQYVARLITRKLRGLDPPGPFEYLDKGTLAIVGTPYAIADFQVVRLWGWPAWCMWLGVHLLFLIGFGNRQLVMAQWAIALLSKRRSVRTFSPEAEALAAPAPVDRPVRPRATEPSRLPAEGG
jgi:NADH:ubiquinone reductase (H+-translocating)